MTATTRDKMEFAYLMGRYTDMALPVVKRLMRLAATHVRIETELTNGYKKHKPDCHYASIEGQNYYGPPRAEFACCGGQWDGEWTEYMKRKRDHIDKRIEAMCAEYDIKVEYGALTVRLMLKDQREVYVP